MKRRKEGTYADELRPCPFCGSDNLLYNGENRGVYIWCMGCMAQGPFIRRPLHPKDQDASMKRTWQRTKGNCEGMPRGSPARHLQTL